MKNKITFLILFNVLCLSCLQAQVTQEWVARYNGPGNGSDRASSLAVDGLGNVYVTGSSGTVKYNPSGVQQWVQNFVGRKLAIDNLGNVYVTGGNDEYATIKYNSSGDTLWTARYNGPGNGHYGEMSLAVDSLGNVYVTGGSDHDYATIKYNSSGILQWIQRYRRQGSRRSSAIAIAIDGSRNVYVTGSTLDSVTNRTDYATIKYNSSGDSIWVQTYNGPGNDYDSPLALAVDGSGNVYVTGQSNGSPNVYATIKYNSSGVLQWIQRFGPVDVVNALPSLAIDDSGNVYVTGGDGDYATIKYNSFGDSLWVARYNGPGNSIDGGIMSIVVDGSGNVYVTGITIGNEMTFDYGTVKYNSSGIQQWAQIYNGPGNNIDGANAIAVDGSGNIYVTGESDGSKPGRDYATIKYSQTSGNTSPSRLNAQSIDSSFIKVTWQDNSTDEDGFYIERTKINDSTHWEVIDAVPQNVNHYEDYFVTRNLKYYYRVNAYSGNVFSGYSNTDSAILGGEPALIPAPPSNLTFIKRTPKAISMGWHDNSGNENGFIIFRKSERDLFFNIIDSVNTDVVTYQEVGVSPNLNYSYKICSFNSSGISDYSNTLMVLAKSAPPFKTPDLAGNHILYGNYPNPFNPVTKINYDLRITNYVSLKVYDILGKEIWTLVNEKQNAGIYEVDFDGSNFPSGVYFYKLTVDGNIIDTKRMMLLK